MAALGWKSSESAKYNRKIDKKLLKKPIKLVPSAFLSTPGQITDADRKEIDSKQ